MDRLSKTQLPGSGLQATVKPRGRHYRHTHAKLSLLWWLFTTLQLSKVL